MKVPFVRLDRAYEKHKEEYDKVTLEVMASGHYVLGPRLLQFESAFASFLGIDHCIGVGSGLDALKLALLALGIGAGDEVLVPANTFIASALAIRETGARPVLVEPDAFYNMDPEQVRERITPKTKALLVVHLYGQSARMEELLKIARTHGLFVVEDCAQSHGALVGAAFTGTLGDVGCFSFYPTKGIGAFGDGGAVVCRDEALARRIRMLRNYGSLNKYEYPTMGINSRLDELQAGLLSVRLAHFAEELTERRKRVQGYLKDITNPLVVLPKVRPGGDSVWHLFVVQVDHRVAFVRFLQERGIQTGIHYPEPLHLIPALSWMGYQEGDYPIAEGYSHRVVSLPLYSGMTQEELDYVVGCINAFGIER